MRVTGQPLSDVSGQKPQQTNAPKADQNAAQTATKSASNAGVAVVIGGAARSLSKDSVNQHSEIDNAKVQAVKASIKDGTFVVNPEAIADKLLSNSQDLLNTTLK
ncbi:flagellar biosynthesis anti-sigma factor FlgM [Rhodoferax sp. GW822-FHT02A01]|uniref:flagellar biosynthesis anti-sigma factor FlgM n=1 Tax=Rhodoferax sp. GW822-FHT02A01 TaxID=3141537 RepID=UPI00315D5E28